MDVSKFDLWMQELTTRLGVSGILCARIRTPASFQLGVFGHTEMQTDLENTFLTKADVCRPSADLGSKTA